MERRVTIRDIAKAAGVHFTTVSRALTKHPCIPAATRERIAKIAVDLGYAPDPMVSALTNYRIRLKATSFHGNIAWMTNGFTRNGWNSCATFGLYFEGAKKRAEQLGYRLEEFWLREPGMSTSRMEEILAARNIRALIFSPQPGSKMRIRLSWDRFSAVRLGYTLAWPTLRTVSADCFNAVQVVVRHARSLGYRRLGFVVTSKSDARVDRAWSGGFLSFQRLWPREEKLPLLSTKVITATNFLKWVKAHRPDVVVSQELWLLDVLEKNGYSVPRDIGFATPTLTSFSHTRKISGVNENALETGGSAVEAVVAMVQRGESGIPTTIQSVLTRGTWEDGDTLLRKTSETPP